MVQYEDNYDVMCSVKRVVGLGKFKFEAKAVCFIWVMQMFGKEQAQRTKLHFSDLQMSLNNKKEKRRWSRMWDGIRINL